MERIYTKIFTFRIIILPILLFKIASFGLYANNDITCVNIYRNIRGSYSFPILRESWTGRCGVITVKDGILHFEKSWSYKYYQIKGGSKTYIGPWDLKLELTDNGKITTLSIEGVLFRHKVKIQVGSEGNPKNHVLGFIYEEKKNYAKVLYFVVSDELLNRMRRRITGVLTKYDVTEGEFETVKALGRYLGGSYNPAPLKGYMNGHNYVEFIDLATAQEMGYRLP